MVRGNSKKPRAMSESKKETISKVKSASKNSAPVEPEIEHGNEVNKTPKKGNPNVTVPGSKTKRRKKDLKEAGVESNLTRATVMEDGNILELEVDGQLTEFNSDVERDTESESDEEVEVLLNENANASRLARKESEPRNEYNGRKSSESIHERACSAILPIDPELQQQQDEAEMLKFVNFIRKKGLVIVDAKALDKQQGHTGPGRVIPSSNQNKSVGGKNLTHRLRGENLDVDNTSAITIYKNAVQESVSQRNFPSDEARNTSSSDEPIDTSDELTDTELINVDQFVAAHAGIRLPEPPSQPSQMGTSPNDGQQAHASHQVAPHEREARYLPPPVMPPAELQRSSQMIREAEAGKITAYNVKGNLQVSEQVLHSALLDENYLLVGNYVDEATCQKIGEGAYVDFSKLMPHDKLGTDEGDQRMEMVNRGGRTYWIPMGSDKEATHISNYGCWEQAFRVFSNIYTRYHPHKSGELIQYNHTIFTAAQSFAWENVYRYDREFRIHMSRYHLQQNWGVILQQAWSMFLKDKIPVPGTPGGGPREGGQGSGNYRRRKLCFDFNSGYCSFGRKCKFDHRCSFCNKFGHGAANCRKANKNNSSPAASAMSHRGNGNGQNGNERWDKYEKEHQSGHGNSKK